MPIIPQPQELMRGQTSVLRLYSPKLRRTEMASAEMRCSRAARCCILRPVEAAVMAATTVGPL